MKWPERIRLHQPLRSVRVANPASSAEWEERLRDGEKAAYERGRLDGERALSEQLLRQRTELLELHRGAVDSLRRAVPQVVQQTESALIALALEAARRFVSNLPVSPEMVEAVVREAVAQAQEASEFHIYLHADDLALLKQHNSALLTPSLEAGRMHFQASAEVTRGGCLVQTRFGVIDARRETKLQQIERALSA
jgi:flagellar assembly protein FliH